ncbi:hypothetical protein B0H14DRAFT_3580469 [Mycena olivaceomarginata]|nr:hypothetical protein B0H14DRAFT_3580469 [Mycena olivaceomarginata]
MDTVHASVFCLPPSLRKCSLVRLPPSSSIGSFSVDIPGQTLSNSDAADQDSSQVNPIHADGPAPHDNDEFLNREDLVLHSSDVQRWVRPKYEMRLDELLLFVDFFNNSAIAIEQGTIFLCGRTISYFANKLRELDWIQPVSPEQLCQAGMTNLAHLISTQAHDRVNHIVFFQHHNWHWTTVHRALRTPQLHLVWYNFKREPNEPPPPPDDGHDHVILNLFFRDSRPATPPAPEPWVINPVYLGLQHESYTCGFWVVYVGFSLILDFVMVNEAIKTLDIKELVGPIYVSFLMDTVGVPASLVQVLFSVFRPRVQLGHLPSDITFLPTSDRICPCRSQRSRASVKCRTEHRFLPQAAAISTELQSSSVFSPTIQQLDPGVMDLLPSEGGFDENHTRHIIPARGLAVAARRMRMLVNSDLMSDQVLDGYLELFALDIASGRETASTL